jgi:hypothetical protein
MKVQEALKAALEAIDLYDYTGTQAESELYAKAESLCKSALSDIGKCEPVGEVQGVAVNWYHGTPADYSLLYTSPISKEWVGISEERLLRLILAHRNVDDLLKVVTAELKQLNAEKG